MLLEREQVPIEFAQILFQFTDVPIGGIHMSADGPEIRRERIHIAEEGIRVAVEFALATLYVLLHAV